MAPERPALTRHRRETLVWILLPVGGGGLLVAGAGVAAMLLRKASQVALLADWLFTILVLCPVVLCLLPLCVGLITLVFGMNHAHDQAAHLLGKGEAASETVKDKTLEVTESVSRKSIDFNARLASLDKVWGVFDRKEGNDGEPNP